MSRRHYTYEADWRPYAFPEESAGFSTEEELRAAYTPVRLEAGGTLPAGGMPILSDGVRAVINIENEMTMIFGATASKKTRTLILPLMSILALARESMVVMDIKGELSNGVSFPQIQALLAAMGYDCRFLNFRDKDGDGYNLLLEPYRLYRSGRRDEAAKLVNDIAESLSTFYHGTKADPFWEMTAKQFLVSTAILLFRLCRRPEQINMLTLASYTDTRSCQLLEQVADVLDQDQNDNIMTMLRSVLSEPDKTKMSTLATVNSMLTSFVTDEKLLRMFDRLGRRDDETPFVVEWFTKHGIEVWSAMEGQQRFETHVDKLMNYIRFWQASGESLKTSVRTKTRSEQLTEQGLYTGGTVPYGYHLVHRGRMNKRNKPVYDLEIDEKEAEVVQLIFQKYVREGYGAQRISRYLGEVNIRARSGKSIPNCSIVRMLKNVMYTGIIKNGESQSAPIPELQIIDEDTFARAQQMMRDRTTHHSTTPFNSKGQSLLVGNIYCGHCGNRLTLTTSGRRTKKKDAEHCDPRLRYLCHFKVRHPDECDGQSGYGVRKVDEIVKSVICAELAGLKAIPESTIVSRQQKVELRQAKAEVAQLQEELEKKQAEIADFRAETIKVIRGESKFSADLLNGLLDEAEKSSQETEEKLRQARDRVEELMETAASIKKEYQKILTWADLFEMGSFAEQKVIAAQLIKSVKLYRGYRIEIEFNISFEDFQHFSWYENGKGEDTPPASPAHMFA